MNKKYNICIKLMECLTPELECVSVIDAVLP